MTDRPILFSAPMIRALLDGRKSQTRRILKPQPEPCEHKPYPSAADEFVPSIDEDGLHCATCGNGIRIANTKSGVRGIPVRFRKGDRLWVRESAWYDPHVCNGLTGLRCFFEGTDVRHQFAGPTATAPFASTAELFKASKMQVRRPGIHMPRWASRLTLTVTDVRVQRLQEISDDDAEAEGCPECPQCHGVGWINSGPDGGWQCPAKGCGDAYVDQYARLWDEINGAGAWAANPFVVAISFSVTKANIDAARAA